MTDHEGIYHKVTLQEMLKHLTDDEEIRALTWALAHIELLEAK